VLRDVLLGGVERHGDLADRRFLMNAQEIDDPQAGRLGQGAEATGDQLGCIWCEWTLHGH
jgi:hypothetical protein